MFLQTPSWQLATRDKKRKESYSNKVSNQSQRLPIITRDAINLQIAAFVWVQKQRTGIAKVARS